MIVSSHLELVQVDGAGLISVEQVEGLSQFLLLVLAELRARLLSHRNSVLIRECAKSQPELVFESEKRHTAAIIGDKRNAMVHAPVFWA